MQELRGTVNKFYLANGLLMSAIFLSIIFMFVVQFKVESLQDEIVKTETDIVAYQDKIQLLEVEWVYLTRPERLRTLASAYLQNNGYALASQIKDVDKLEKYYLVNYQKAESRELVVDDQAVAQVSF
jgi:cell division protein FtsL